MENQKEAVINRLKQIDREGIDKLIEFMEKRKFFTGPGSTKYHNAFEGGLLQHSVNVAKLFGQLCEQYKLDIPEDSIFLVDILHDLCKASLYLGDEKPYKYNGFVGRAGHAKLSINRISRFIKLTEQEEKIIKYHMGMYAVGGYINEYDLKELKDAFEDKLVKLFHFCDDIVAQCIDT